MLLKVVIDDIVVEYELIYKRIKNIYINYSNDLIRVSAPKFISIDKIEKFLIESYPKIQKRRVKSFNSLLDKQGNIKVLGNYYSFSNIDFLLKEKLNDYINYNYDRILKMMSVDNAPIIKFVRVKTFLGQYSKKDNVVKINILCAHLDKELLEYIIIHELSHIKHAHHQREFWEYLKIYCPYYKTYRNRAKKEFVYYENN